MKGSEQKRCKVADYNVYLRQLAGGKPLGQRCLAAVEHGFGGSRSQTSAAFAFVQSATLGMLSLVVSASQTTETVTTPANLFEKRSVGFVDGVFAGSCEITDWFLFDFVFPS